MSNEINEQSSKTLASPKLSKVVIIVLMAHVVLIMGFGAYCLLKGNTSAKDDDIAANSDPIAGQEEVAATGSQPAVETSMDESAANSVAPIVPDNTLAASSSMPPTHDPIWNNNVQPVPANNQVVNNTPAPNPVPAGSYTVQKGDSLYRIAKKNGVAVAALKQANGMNSDALKIGQVLTIPGGGQVAPVNSQVASTPNVVQAAVANSHAENYQSYKVAPGDTLWKIARNFNTKPDVIAKLNNISDPSKLKVGTQIKVPGLSRETAQPVAQPQAAMSNVDVAAVPQNRS